MRVKNVSVGGVYLDYKTSGWKYNLNIQFENQHPDKKYTVDSQKDYQTPFKAKQEMQDHVAKLREFHKLDIKECYNEAPADIVRIH